jgi:hypothetical protein
MNIGALRMPWDAFTLMQCKQWVSHHAFEKQETSTFKLSVVEYKMTKESKLIVGAHQRKLKFQND